jgi:hypothetical protein
LLFPASAHSEICISLLFPLVLILSCSFRTDSPELDPGAVRAAPRVVYATIAIHRAAGAWIAAVIGCV